VEVSKGTKEKRIQIYLRFGSFTHALINMAVLVAQIFFEVLPLIFSTDYSPIHWLQSVLKNQAFLKMYFFFYTFLKIRRHVGEMMNWISMVPP
jgi:hypothetical protein